MIANLQCERMDEQRAILPGLKGIHISNSTNDLVPTPDDNFLDMLMRCQVSESYYQMFFLSLL